MTREELLATLYSDGTSRNALGNLLGAYFNNDWDVDVKDELGVDIKQLDPGAWKHVVTIYVRENKELARKAADEIDQLLGSGMRDEDLEWLVKELHTDFVPRPKHIENPEFKTTHEGFEALRDELRRQVSDLENSQK